MIPPVPPTVARRLARAPAAMLAAAAGLALAGCGSSHSKGTSADPAASVPASAAVYVGATVRPEGSLRSGALAAGHALTHQSDPYLRLLGALQTTGSSKLQYSRDVAGWLGPHAGLFLTSLKGAGGLVSLIEGALLGQGSSNTGLGFSSAGLQGALLLDTSEPTAARAFLTSQAKKAHARDHAYRGVSYEANGAGLAFGLVKEMVVIGSQSALRSVIDTTQGGSSLARQASYAKLTEHAPAQALGQLYVKPGALSGEGGTAGSLLGLLGSGQPTDAWLQASSSAISLDVDSLGAAGTEGILSASPEAAAALAALPGESWLALGLPAVAGHLAGDVKGLETLTGLLGGSEESEDSLVSLKGLLGGLLEPLQAMSAPTAAARSHFGSWMGAAGVFASGSGLLELQAGVVIDSSEPAASKAAVAALGQALRAKGNSTHPITVAGTEAALAATIKGLPLALDIAAGRDASGKAKFVLALGTNAVSSALDSSTALAASPARTAAEKALGEGIEPSLQLDVPTLDGLLEAVGLASSPTLSGLFSVLHEIGAVDGGGRRLDSDVSRYRLVLGLNG